eukprot:11444334-Karenia_brevis.AAC.1
MYEVVCCVVASGWSKHAVEEIRKPWIMGIPGGCHTYDDVELLGSQQTRDKWQRFHGIVGRQSRPWWAYQRC